MIFRKPTGLCFHCQRSTKLLVHQNCGKGRRDGEKLRPISDAGLRKIMKGLPA